VGGRQQEHGVNGTGAVDAQNLANPRLHQTDASVGVRLAPAVERRYRRTDDVARTMDIESLVRAEKWGAARVLIRTRLKREPNNHWLLTRLGLTYYEQRKYQEALALHEEAVLLAPSCPLALWDYAGGLQMLGRHRDALDVYRKLVRRGPNRIAFGPCGEGLAWANGLVADCYYRMMDSLDALGDKNEAFAMLVKHLDMRGPGCRSIYPLGQARKKGQALRQLRPSKAAGI
ncbi:MAG: tetratricopeptide repeat protein, partial [Polyangia bacterium]